jgi:uncharacterized cupin superfamily protein
MYVPDIHSLPLRQTGPTDPAKPAQAITGEWTLLDDGQVEVGVWECSQGTFTRQPVGYDEMMFIASGRATVAHADGEYDLVPGTTWVKSREWPCTWTVHQAVRKMYVIDRRPAAAAPPAHLGNAYTWDVGERKSHPAPLAGDPKQILRELWVHNGLEVGVWECEPGSFGISRDGYDEAMIILSGKATMNATNGQIFRLQAGSVLVTPQGFVGHWEIEETLRKVYVKVMRPN